MDILDISYEYREDLPEISPSTTQLDCSHNKISSSAGLSHLLSLQSLDFSHNMLTKIQGWSLLYNLTILNLSNNHLTSIQGLSQCYALTSITLQHNQIRAVNGLETLRNLQYLNISFNSISEKSAIRGLSLNNKLEVLYLEGNTLKNYRQFCYSIILSLVMLDGNPTPGFTRKGSVKDSYKLKRVAKYNN